MNLSAFFLVLQAAPSVINLADKAVLSVEDTLQSLPGAQKLAAATTKLSGWLTTADQDISAIENSTGVIQNLINTSVAAFNQAKAFSHAAATPAPVAS